MNKEKIHGYMDTYITQAAVFLKLMIIIRQPPAFKYELYTQPYLCLYIYVCH